MSLSPLAEMTVENADVDLRSSKKLADKFSARFAHPEFSRTSVGMRSSLGLRSSQRRVSSDNKQAQWKKNAVERMRRHESGARARVGSGGDPKLTRKKGSSDSLQHNKPRLRGSQSEASTDVPAKTREKELAHLQAQVSGFQRENKQPKEARGA